MADVRTVHTSALTGGELRAIRELLDEAFDGEFGDEDFEHALGGMHAIVRDGDELVAHGAVVMRRVLHDGRALRTGYVEAVAVRPDRRRLGLGGVVMDALETVIRGGYEVGALSASDDGAALYASRGWQRWTGTASVLAPDGLTPTPGEEDGIHLLPVTAQLTPGGDLACDWRGGDLW
ncbi:GNAT family N-acetyltransferase [Pseudonocardia nigra]|uniref:GNAT family N-acetyltransferase n=1 Tax=Pseudonocardia nigra TaxID=1921578 RepID=UPI001C5F2D58|nr:GNAT family N-acetyltransferase [Pseudonocardia nigra]